MDAVLAVVVVVPVDLFAVSFPVEEVAEEVLQGGAEVAEVVGVQEGIACGIQVGEDDAEEHEGGVHLEVYVEGLDAVDGVEGDPADHEEEDYDGEVLGGLDLVGLLDAERPDHGAARAAALGRGALLRVHGDYLAELETKMLLLEQQRIPFVILLGPIDHS